MIYEELTDELLEAIVNCDGECIGCPAQSVCAAWTRRALATALLEERAKPKVWDGAPDNAFRSIVNWYDESRGFIKSKVLTRELPKTRARQIAEQEGHGLAEKYGWNAAAKELVTNKIEAALNKYAEELKGGGMTLFEQAVKTYGAESQVRKAVEELTELSVALLHSLDGRGDTENIREEMADVEIMLEQLHVIFGYGDYRLVKECRLAERLLT